MIIETLDIILKIKKEKKNSLDWQILFKPQQWKIYFSRLKLKSILILY